jgi:hypothetical protein
MCMWPLQTWSSNIDSKRHSMPLMGCLINYKYNCQSCMTIVDTFLVPLKLWATIASRNLIMNTFVLPVLSVVPKSDYKCVPIRSDTLDMGEQIGGLGSHLHASPRTIQPSIHVHFWRCRIPLCLFFQNIVLVNQIQRQHVLNKMYSHTNLGLKKH